MQSLFPDIKHHSASSINSFIGKRSSWYVRYFLGKKGFKPSKDAARGTAVEAGLNYWITETEPDIQEAIKIAHAKFVSETNGVSDITPEFRASINPLVNKVIASFNERYANIQFTIQEKITIDLSSEGIKIPIIGYLDFDSKKLIVDCKVTKKTPKALSQEHVIQASLYKRATGKEVEFHYTIPLAKEIKILPLRLSNEQYENGLRLAKQACFAMERLYESVADGLDLRAAFFPDPSKLWASDKADVLKEFGMDIDESDSDSEE